MGQYLPIVVMLVLAVVFAAVSFIASKLLAPRSADRREVRAVRVRHRARARSRPSASRCASTWWR